MLNNTPDILTIKDLMKVLQIGKNTALSLAQDNIISAHKISGKWRFFKEDVEEFILRS